MLLEEVSFFGSTLRQYLVALIILVLAIAVGKVAYAIMSRLVRSFTSKTKTQLDDLIINLVDRPIVFLIGLGGLFVGIAQLTLPFNVEKFLDNTIIVLFVLNVAWVVINFIDALIINYLKPFAEKSKSEVDDAMVPIIGKIAKIVLWVIVLLMLMTNLGYDVSALLAGLGLGGLAFALAAQDLLSNLFGGFAILTDKPFKIGDRIRFGTNDGFVREIGFRTTRIETLDGTMLIVPNAELAKIHLENVSKEPARRVLVKLGLEYGTPTKKVKLAEDILHDIILKKKEVLDNHDIGFSDFGDFALIITLVYWVKDPAKTMKVKSEVNMEIKDRFEKAGLRFAYPTHTVLLSKRR